MYFLTVLETRKIKINFWQNSFFGENPLGLQLSVFLLCHHMAGRKRDERETNRRDGDRLSEKGREERESKISVSLLYWTLILSYQDLTLKTSFKLNSLFIGLYVSS